jgi:hypothetical protein
MRRTSSCGRSYPPESSTQQKATRTAASPTPRRSISFWTSFTGATVTVWRCGLPPLQLDAPGRFVYLRRRKPLEALGTSPLEGSAMAQRRWAIAFLCRTLCVASTVNDSKLAGDSLADAIVMPCPSGSGRIAVAFVRPNAEFARRQLKWNGTSRIANNETSRIEQNAT